MLEIALLERPVPVTQIRELDPADPEVTVIVDLIDRGEYLEAALRIQPLLERRIYDMRLIGYYLYGIFLERGMASLPDLFDCIARLLAETWPVLTPTRRKERLADKSLVWLFRHLLRAFEYSQRTGDIHWIAWVEAGNFELVRATLASARRVRSALEAMPQPLECADHWAKLEAWFRAFRVQAPAPPVVVSTSERGEAVEQVAVPASWSVEVQVEAGPRPDEAEPAQVDILEVECTPPLRLLLRKLEVFEALVERQQLTKAAVVAHDIQRVLSQFDPRQYFPGLFAGYVRLLSTHGDRLGPLMENDRSFAFQAMAQFYQVDLEGFLES